MLAVFVMLSCVDELSVLTVLLSVTKASSASLLLFNDWSRNDFQVGESLFGMKCFCGGGSMDKFDGGYLFEADGEILDHLRR